MDRFAGFDGKPKSLNKFAYADGNPVMAVDPSGMVTLAQVSTAAGVSGILNATFAFDSKAPLTSIATNFAVGSLEGVLFLGGGAVAAKGAIKLARFINLKKLTGPAELVFSKLKPLGPTIPGSRIPTRFIIETSQGKLLISSNVQGGEVVGAFKHVFSQILNRRGRPGSSTVLAEALAIQELQAAAEIAILQGIKRGERMVVTTQFAKWELIFDYEKGILKLYHALPQNFKI